MYVSTAGCNTNLQEVVSHHLTRNGWGEYTEEHRTYRYFQFVLMFILLLYSCNVEYVIPLEYH
jgi:hypothetical protein